MATPDTIRETSHAAADRVRTTRRAARKWLLETQHELKSRIHEVRLQKKLGEMEMRDQAEHLQARYSEFEQEARKAMQAIGDEASDRWQDATDQAEASARELRDAYERIRKAALGS